MLKRLFDIMFSIIILLMLSPLIIITLCLIRLNLGSPVIFKQQRPGLHGKMFCMYKFRTMTDEKGEHGDLMPDSVRLTKFGKIIRKLSLDEFPQLINVLKGDMSVVGPRPLLTEYLEVYTSEQIRRHDVNPGITGWAQVNGRNAISWEEKFKLDIWYVDHQSLWLDIKIIFLTVYKIFKSEGISQIGHATSEKYQNKIN